MTVVAPSPKPSYSGIATTFRSLCHLQRAVQERQGQEFTLLFVGETARLITVLLELLKKPLPATLGNLRLLQRIRLPEAWIRLLRNITDHAFVRMQLITALLDDWQVLNRLFGLMDFSIASGKLFNEVRRKRRENMDIDWQDTTLEALQNLSMISFHGCEATACLASRKILSWSANTQEKLIFAAVRSWAAFTFLDIARALLERRKRKAEGEKSDSKEYQEREEEWWDMLLSNLAWAPVTLHWGTRGGLLPEYVASVLATYATFGLVKGVWKRSA